LKREVQRKEVSNNDFGSIVVVITALPARTFGLEPPANPAFTAEVPLSSTMGWLRRIELPPTLSPPSAALSLLMVNGLVGVVVFVLSCC
jgi:hypothetical protein